MGRGIHGTGQGVAYFRGDKTIDPKRNRRRCGHQLDDPEKQKKQDDYLRSLWKSRIEAVKKQLNEYSTPAARTADENSGTK